MASSDSLRKTDLFKQQVGFRIPALLHIPDSNTLLAFAESRLGSKDESADLLYLRRGEYNKSSKDFQWEDAKPIQSAQLDNCRSMNPCPVYEKEKKTVFLFFIAVDRSKSEQEQVECRKNAGHLCYVTSVDNGHTWCDTIHLTDKCNGPKTEACISETINTWATFALGPGHGIQLNSGHLVIPANAHVIESKEIRVRAFTFYSEDHGDSWQIGEFISGVECGECQVVSLDQGNGSSEQALIYCNARNNKANKNQYRVEAFSTDGGKTFTEGKLVKKLVEYSDGCHGSIISFPASDISHVQNYSELKNYHTQQGGDASNFHIILFSHITNSNPRRDLGIYLCTYSGDAHTQTNPYSGGCLTWTNPWVFFPDRSAYSELAFVKLPEERNPIVTCLFEYGCKNNMISFCVLQIYDIIEKTVKKME
nr:sialidase-4-like isoform 1 [Potamotrygon motoro]QFF91252.1 sialidase-4-like isoform 2 [Potamotrygon motoro]QFF91255.1 sialidase-4-like isoform 5 [Potamotrygon motoro]QFF91260.1 sialidase-4-like isoform 10 [Potamotrygon motoro]